MITNSPFKCANHYENILLPICIQLVKNTDYTIKIIKDILPVGIMNICIFSLLIKVVAKPSTFCKHTVANTCLTIHRGIYLHFWYILNTQYQHIGLQEENSHVREKEKSEKGRKGTKKRRKGKERWDEKETGRRKRKKVQENKEGRKWAKRV